MYFRPLLRFTLVVVPMFAALIALGVWQLARLHWKLGLIAAMNANLHAAPLSPDELLSRPANHAQYHRVALSGRFENDKEAYVYTTAMDGAPVYHVVTPFMLDDGRVFLVDRGFIPLTMKDPSTRMRGLLQGELQIVGIWRTPDPPGFFAGRPDIAHRVWYARDVRGIAKALAIKTAAPVIVEVDATPIPGGWPKGGQTVVMLPNDHLQYALTWFLLAAGLLVVYFAYHRAHGRLGLRR